MFRMSVRNSLVSLSTIGILALAVSGCGDDTEAQGDVDAAVDTPDAAVDTPDAAVDTPDAAPPVEFGTADDVSKAEQLWTDMGDYTTWSLMPNTAQFEPSAAPHGAFARMYINDVAEGDLVNLPNGSIIIKENYASETEGDYGAVTVMYKIDGYAPNYGDWFWAKFLPDGTLDQNPAGVALAGAVGAGGAGGCVPCHEGADGDYVFKN